MTTATRDGLEGFSWSAVAARYEAAYEFVGSTAAASSTAS